MTGRGVPSVALKAGREKSLAQRHPWIFSGAIERVDGAPASGDTVAVRTHDGAVVATAAYSPSSQIRARIWAFAPVGIDAAWFAQRVRAAVDARAGMLDADHTACRLVHGESDGLPGVIADRYGDTVVVQFLSAGADRWRDAIADALVAATHATTVVERSDAEVRQLEGLAPRNEVLRGALAGPVPIREDGIAYRVDVMAGQKTGFYLDQRTSRHRVRRLAHGRSVLNAFCYTGGFTLAALAGGARDTVSIDSSADALALARSNLAANRELASRGASWREADVFTELRRLRDEGRSFGLAILDPPKFAPTAAHAARAARAYKDINLLAFKLLEPGGLLATFSCSGGVSADLFQKIVAGAALDAKVDAAIVGRFSASGDHPVALAFPEGDYLKGLLVRRSA
ncbi:MAG: class I SAM-dependent rRNA methyltransferase [Betaproteobacteria bacterium]|nr:class I SAM-dependent rRNA methyltransferase [Betaproteobacteria bacterium]